MTVTVSSVQQNTAHYPALQFHADNVQEIQDTLNATSGIPSLIYATADGTNHVIMRFGIPVSIYEGDWIVGTVANFGAQSDYFADGNFDVVPDSLYQVKYAPVS